LTFPGEPEWRFSGQLTNASVHDSFKRLAFRQGSCRTAGVKKCPCRKEGVLANQEPSSKYGCSATEASQPNGFDLLFACVSPCLADCQEYGRMDTGTHEEKIENMLFSVCSVECMYKPKRDSSLKPSASFNTSICQLLYTTAAGERQAQLF
jgi:hypothetical protein